MAHILSWLSNYEVVQKQLPSFVRQKRAQSAKLLTDKAYVRVTSMMTLPALDRIAWQQQHLFDATRL
jgi:hypothetical protein